MQWNWLRLENRFPENPKIVPLSDPAFRAYITALCYAHRNLTDGWVPGHAFQYTAKTATELIRPQLWVPGDDGEGFRIHDYLDHQMSRADIEKLSAKRSDAGRRGARERWQKP